MPTIRRLDSVFPPGFDSGPSGSTASSGHYVHSTQQFLGILVDSYNTLTPSDTIIVASAWYGKQTSAPKHEFILLRVEDKSEDSAGTKPLFNYLILDRNVVSKRTKSGKAVKQSQTSVHGGKAADTFRVSYDGDADRLFEDCNLHPHRLIERLQFSSNNSLHLYELVVLANLVSTEHPDYHATKSNCYLFAGVIWDSLCQMYPDAIRESIFERERGKNGLYRFVITETQVEATCRRALEEISKARVKISGQKAEFEEFINRRIATKGRRGATRAAIQGSTG